MRYIQALKIRQRDEALMRVCFNDRPKKLDFFQCLVSLKRIDKVGYRRGDISESKLRQVKKRMVGERGEAVEDHYTKFWQVRSGRDRLAAERGILDVQTFEVLHFQGEEFVIFLTSRVDM